MSDPMVLSQTILMAILTAAMAVIGYFVRDLKQTMIAKDAEHDQAIDKIRSDFNDFRARMPELYVMREDWIRSTVGFDKKLDDVSKQISCIDRKISRFIGVKSQRDS